MKRIACVGAALALGLLASGCVFTSGQIRIAFDLPKFTTSTETTLSGEDIDLNTEQEYKDNKDKLKDLSDIAVLGKIYNGGGTDIDVVVYMTPDITTHTTAAQLKADVSRVLLWGPFRLKAGETKVVDWDESAKIFNAKGKAALLTQAKGDGTFSIYAIADAATYTFSVSNGVLVLVLDAGI